MRTSDLNFLDGYFDLHFVQEYLEMQIALETDWNFD